MNFLDLTSETGTKAPNSCSNKLEFELEISGRGMQNTPLPKTGAVAQLVRVPDCRSGGCGFESRLRRSFETGKAVKILHRFFYAPTIP